MSAEVTATVVTALGLGAVYALVALAATTVALVARTLHLAVGAVLVLGVLVRLTAGGLGATDLVAVAAGLAAGALASALLEPLVLRPLGRRSHDAGARGSGEDRALRWLVGLAVAGAVIESATARWLTARQFRPPPLVGGEGVVTIAGAEVERALIVALVLGAATALALDTALRRTRWGRRLRLVGGSAQAAALSGIDPSATRATALAVAGAVATLAGLLLAPVAFAGTGQAAALTIRGVAAASLLSVTGGVGAGIVGGFLLGAADAAGQSAWPGAGGDVAVAGVVLGLLVVRGGDLRRAWSRAW